MKKTILIVLALFACFRLTAQNQAEAPQPPTIIPPSPNAAALGSFGQIPVGHFTGRPQIDIPFYSINVGGVTVPVKLSYQFMGLRPTDVVGTTGLGWVLDAGGAISRTVKGRPDEKARFQYADQIRDHLTNGEFDWGLLFPSNQSSGGDGGNGGGDDGPSDVGDNGRISGTTNSNGPSAADIRDMKRFINQIINGQVDTEPDIFSYSAPFGGGQFLFDWDANLVQLNASDLKIETPYDGIPLDAYSDDDLPFFSSGQSFIVTTADGVKYSFSVQEMGNSDRNPDHPGASQYQSAWRLSSIKATNGQTISFSYFSPDDYELASKSVQHSAIKNIFTANCYENCQTPSESETEVETWHKPQYLQQITYDDGKIVFSYSSDRTDLGNWKLDEITQFNENDEKLSSYRLEYDYFGNQYLKLLRVIKRGQYDQTDQVYTLDYNESNSFPDWRTTGLDHFGYYNGKIGNIKLYKYRNPLSQEVGTVDRTPDDQYSSLGALKRITYPTGGYTDFTFESHEYFLSTTINRSLTAIARTGSANGLVSCDEVEGTPLACIPYVSKTVVIPQGSGNIKISVQLDYNGQAVTPSDQLDVQLFRDGVLVGYYTSSTIGFNDLLLGSGNYELVARATVNGTQARTTLTWDEPAPITQGTPTGGLRIKAIESHTHTGVLANKMIYEYQKEDGRPSGVAFGNRAPMYGVEYVVHNQVEGQSEYIHTLLPSDTIHNSNPGSNEANDIEESDDDAVQASIDAFNLLDTRITKEWSAVERYMKASLSSSSLIELGGITGPSVGYTRVVEKQVNEQGTMNGMQVYEFQSRADFPMPTGSAFPFQMRSYRDGVRGLLKAQISFSGDIATDLKKVSELRNQYIIHDPNSARGTTVFPLVFGIKFHRFYDFQIDGASSIDYQLTDYGLYEINSGWSYLNNSITKTYGTASEQDMLETSTSYVYGDLAHYMPTEQTAINSKGETMRTTFTYPHAYASGMNVYQSMLDENQIAIPIKTEIFRNGDFLSSQRSEFIWHQDQGLPSKVFTQKRDEPEELRLEYKYGDLGNPVEFNKANDISSAVIWEAGNIRPLARAVNAKQNQIWHTSFEEDNNSIAGGWTGNQSKQNPQINATELLAGTYWFTYWKKENGKWEFNKEQVQVTGTGFYRNLVGTIDEVRIYPLNAQMTTIAYDQFHRAITECNALDQVIRYAYDEFGRLHKVIDEDGNLRRLESYQFSNN